VLVPEIDNLLGIQVYATKTIGIGGVIRKSLDDFVVEEVLVDGSKAKIDEETLGSQVLGASLSKQRYLLCVLIKRNWDNLIAIKSITKQLGKDQQQIAIAGIKDAKAVTAQHVTIENGSMEELSKVNIRDIQLRPVGYFRDEMSPYYMLGNYFTIRIKAITQPKATIEKRIRQTVEEIETLGGIPNFFGHQRFGTTRPITHLVGRAIVNDDFERAAMLFLANPSPNEHPESTNARRELESKQDFRQALQNFPKQLRYERLMLSRLAEKPDDFIGAFRRLPFKLQTLFVQAYQSYLFNRFLSQRIRSGIPLNTVKVGDYFVNVEHSGLPMIQTGRIVNADTLGAVTHLVTTGRARVAVPLLGMKQKLSHGIMGEIEKQILEAENIQAKDFRIDAMLEISGKGGLRPAVSPIQNFKLEEVSKDADTEKQQAKLGFMLLRGSYATMLLREVMKPIDPIGAGF
jgi:tRNA pseudouridine13 synthase